jgi:predicted lipid-binding transport protein (Tim44 family)
MNQTRMFSTVLPATWFGRLIAALIAGCLAIIGLFFLAFALVAIALIAAGVLARLWWVARKLRAQREAGVIDGVYSVEIEATPAIGAESTRSMTPDKRE